MNSANKKISEYKIEDIKELFFGVLRKISSKIILIEIGNDFLNIGLAKFHNKGLFIKKVFSQKIPKEALDKSIPTDPLSFGSFLKQIIDEKKINTNKIALSLPSDTCYTRLIEIPEEVSEDESIGFVENPNSVMQIPISLENSDFEIHLTNLPKQKIKNKFFNKYFLTSMPKKNIDVILDSIKKANLEICSIQMSHMCIANLLKSEIDKLKENELIISVDLLDEFTQFLIFDSSGPLFIKRLASIKNYPSIDEMKKMNKGNIEINNKSKNQGKTETYHPLSKLDLKILIREISRSYRDFLDENKINKKAKIFLSGRNSQHKNLVEILGESLKMDTSVISPINNFCIKEFSYNPDEINQFSMSRLVGLGLTLIKNNKFENELLNREFIFKSFSYKENIDDDSKKKEDKTISDLMDSLETLNYENKQIKEQSRRKTKSEDKKKELQPLPDLKIKDKLERKTKSEDKKKELPPLPNLKLSSNTESANKKLLDNEVKFNKKEDNPQIKKNKSFKMDTSFLKND